MVIVKVYTVFNTTHEFTVDDMNSGREYAKRIITDGLWLVEPDGTELFFPVHQVVKVKLVPQA